MMTTYQNKFKAGEKVDEKFGECLYIKIMINL